MKFKKDTYYIGDPCYVYPKDRWTEFCHQVMEGVSWNLKDGKTKFFVCSTAHGDGVYPVNFNGNEQAVVGVDAGLLSVIPVKLIEKWGTLEEAKKLGFIVEHSGEASYNDGTLTFGMIEVETKGEE